MAQIANSEFWIITWSRIVKVEFAYDFRGLDIEQSVVRGAEAGHNSRALVIDKVNAGRHGALALVLVEAGEAGGGGLVELVYAERVPDAHGRVGRDSGERVVNQGHVPHGVGVAVQWLQEHARIFQNQIIKKLFFLPTKNSVSP